jgi:hypothetical protein
MNGDLIASGAWGVFFPAGTPVVALPDWQAPRLLVPAQTLSARLRGSAFYPAFRLRGRAYRLFLRARAMTARGPVRAGPAAFDADLTTFLADVLPGAGARAVLVGMPGLAQKTTVQLADGTGRVVGYLKHASRPAARERLRSEFELLRTLPAGLGPVPLKYGELAGSDVLLLAAVTGCTPAAGRRTTDSVRRFCTLLVRQDRYRLDVHPWLAAHAAWMDDVGEAIDALAGRHWPAAIGHGDLAPWNLIRGADGSLTAIDWEHGSRHGLPGLDFAGYLLQVAGLVRRWSPRRAREHCMRQLLGDDRLALTPAQAAAMVVLAAYRTFRNAAADGHSAGEAGQVWRRTIWTGEA